MTLNSEIAARAEAVSKVYNLYDRPRDRLKDLILGPLRGGRREFWALRDVSFEVRRGEIVGVIGRNGSGKSTLLQIITGVLTPTTGEVYVAGRVAALLELGSGFNPEYTGRENVFLGGAILGLSRHEIARGFDEIAAFADIGDYIDQPVKTYSSGMYVRLAFAVQVLVQPDVLLVDELISVGDAAFQRKCYRKIDELREHGCTILLVSHDLNAVVNLCTYAYLLERGRLVLSGAPAEVSEAYQKLLFGEELQAPVQEYGDGNAEFSDVWFETQSGVRVSTMSTGSELYFCYRLRFLRSIERPVFGMRIKNVSGIVLCSTNTSMMGIETGKYDCDYCLVVKWKLNLPLAPGYYFFSCGCSYPDVDRFLCRRVDAVKLTVIGSFRNSGFVEAVSGIILETEEHGQS